MRGVFEADGSRVGGRCCEEERHVWIGNAVVGIKDIWALTLISVWSRYTPTMGASQTPRDGCIRPFGARSTYAAGSDYGSALFRSG